MAAGQGIASAQLLEGDVAGAADTLEHLLELLAKRGAQSDLRSILHLRGRRPRRTGPAPRGGGPRSHGAHAAERQLLRAHHRGALPHPDRGRPRALPDAALRLALQLVRAEEQASAPHKVDDGEVPSLERAGDLWALRYAGKTVHLKATKGLDDLARLLAEPDREVHVLDLFGAGVEESSTGPVLDQEARRQLEDRIRSLQAELDDADDLERPRTI